MPQNIQDKITKKKVITIVQTNKFCHHREIFTGMCVNKHSFFLPMSACFHSKFLAFLEKCPGVCFKYCVNLVS